MAGVVLSEKLRVLLDTNVYGALVEREQFDLLESLGSSKKALVYGFQVVRKELRDTPKRLKLGKKSFRSVLLRYYDLLVKTHEFPMTGLIEALARAYSKKYVGGISRAKLWNDFLIVACATLHNLDVVVTEDHHSMVSAPALKAYEKVNAENGLRTPEFHSLDRITTIV